MKFRKTIILIITMMFFITILPAFSGALISGRVSYVEGSRRGIGDGFSFEFDRKGVPAAAYYNLDDSELKFARVESGKWAVTSVAPCGEAGDGLKCSLDFDNSGKPYIAYFSREKNFRVSSFEGGKWKTEIVDDTPGAGLFCSLAISAGGDPVVTYQSPAGTMYARRLVGRWVIEKLDGPGRDTVVKLTKAGDMKILYLAQGGTGAFQVKAAKRDGAAWKISPVPQTSGCRDFDATFDDAGSPAIACVGGSKISVIRESVAGAGIWKEEIVEKTGASGVSVAVAGKGLYSVCYIAEDKKEVKLASGSGAGWDVKKVVSARPGFQMKNLFLTIDPKKRFLIVLHDGDSLNVLLQENDGWKLGRIDGKTRVGGYINLVADKNRNPLICYYDYSNSELHYASPGKDGKFVSEIVDSLGDVGKYASMKTDAAGNPTISYYDATRDDLKFAWRENGKWKWDRIDFNGEVGLFSSLAFDADGRPNISYFDRTNGALKYAVRDSGKWKIEKIVKLGAYGGQSMMFPMPGKKAAVVFVDGVKIAKAAPDESPVKTYLKFAERDSAGKWNITEILGPYAVNITQNWLSGDADLTGNCSVAFADREQKLKIMHFTDGKWRDNSFGAFCFEKASIKLDDKGNPQALFLSGKSRNEAETVYAKFDGKTWDQFPVSVQGKKTGFISLFSSADGKLRFAFEDLQYFLAGYFEQE